MEFEPLISLLGPVFESDLFFVLVGGLLPLSALVAMIDWMFGSFLRAAEVD